jgi:hypothetical protein
MSKIAAKSCDQEFDFLRIILDNKSKACRTGAPSLAVTDFKEVAADVRGI